jgi:signal transduction histidine kinase/CheY-like chemotaxis protein
LADLKRISEQLSSIEDRDSLLERMLETAPISMQIFSADGRSLLVNPALEERFGKGPPPEYNVLEDEVLERQGLIGFLRRAFAGETVTMPPAWYDLREIHGVDTSGTIGGRFGIQATVMPLFDRDHLVRHVLVWGKDVTAELELGLREERQRLAFAAARLVALDTNLTKGTLQVSENANEVMGLGAETRLDTLDDLFALIHVDDRAAFEAAERERSDAHPSDHVFRLVRPVDGAIRWLERRGRVWRDDVSGDDLRRGILMDISERVAREMELLESARALRRTEDQLRQAQKLEALGRLAGGVAHDFNNLLSVILSYGRFVLDNAQLPASVRNDIEAIRRAGDQAANLTRQLLAFGRQQVFAPRVLDFNETVRSTSGMLRRLLGEDIEIVVRTPDDPTLVDADPGQLGQIVMNLALNARDAMPVGGTLTIETQLVEFDEAYSREHLGVVPGPHVMLAVRDTGVGMDEETQGHMFEPFFTTKDKAKGTGLGLATVFGIVKQNRGSIWVDSEPNKGSTFKVYLPRVPPRRDDAGDAVAPATLNGAETVLLVEDQDDVRQVAREILKRYGYRVLEAREPSEALSLCERHEHPIHLLLTDVVMPLMSGRELAERVAPLRPDMRVLFMSGYTEDAMVDQGQLAAGFAFLQKPLVPEGLARRVREVLAYARSPRA